MDVQSLLDAFTDLGAERAEQVVLDRLVILARASTGAERVAAVLSGAPGHVGQVGHVAHDGLTDEQVAGLAGLASGPGPLAVVLAEGRAVRLPRPPQLVVPVLSGSELLGALALERPAGGAPFDQADQVLAGALARQAGCAVAAARTRSQARDLAGRLGVAERLKNEAMAGMHVEEDARASVDRILAAARSSLGMELAYVTRLAGPDQHFVQLSGAEEAFGLEEGITTPAELGYCHYVMSGRLPTLLRDTAADPLAAGLPATTWVGIGAYVAVPLVLPGDRQYGTLCAVSRTARPELGVVDEDLLRVLGTLLVEQLVRLEAQEDARSAVLAGYAAWGVPGRIGVVVQPIVDLRTGALQGLEALARFPDHPEGPAAVFAAAAALGAGVDLELAAVAAALVLLPDLPAEVYLSVNASPATVQDPRLGALLIGVDAGRVVLELTEHVVVEDYAGLVRALDRLRTTGLRVAVDDAGSGFASLQHVLALSPDVIKLDMALVRGIDVDPARRALARALAAFAVELDATLVAEGVETAGELAVLRQLGVTHGQGYHLGRPADLDSHYRQAAWPELDRRRSRPWSADPPDGSDRGEAPERLRRAR